MDTPTARTRTTGVPMKIPKPPQTRWHTHYGQFNLDIKVTIVNKNLAYLDYTKNQMNNQDHREVIYLNFIDKFNRKTIKDKVIEKSAKLVKRLDEYNRDFLERQKLSKDIEGEINK